MINKLRIFSIILILTMVITACNKENQDNVVISNADETPTIAENDEDDTKDKDETINEDTTNIDEVEVEEIVEDTYTLFNLANINLLNMKISQFNDDEFIHPYDDDKDVYWDIGDEGEWRREISDSTQFMVDVINESDSVYESFKLSEIKDLLNVDKNYFAVVESGPNSCHLFYQDEGVTVVDEASFTSEYPFAKESTNWNINETIELGIDLNDIVIGVSVCAVSYQEDNQFYITIMDRDLNIIDTIKTDKYYKFDRIEFVTSLDKQLYYKFYQEDNKKDYKVAIVEYPPLESQHIVVDTQNELYVNGEKLYINQSMFITKRLDYISHNKLTFRVSNHGSVVEYINTGTKLLRKNEFRLNDYYVFIDNNQIIYAEQFGNALDETHPLFSLNIANEMIKSSVNGNTYYFDATTNEMVILDQEFNIIDSLILDERIMELLGLDLLNVNSVWEPLAKGIAFADHNLFAYYSLETKEYIINDSTNNHYAVGNHQAFQYGSYNKTFNESTMTFDYNYEYSRYLDDLWAYSPYFELNGVSYYSDSKLFTSETSQDILDNPRLQPVSRLPKITYNTKEVRIQDIKYHNSIGLAKLYKSNYLGVVVDHVFSSIIEEPVRDFAFNEEAIVYTGYDDRDAGFYYSINNYLTYELGDELVVNSIELIDNLAYIVHDGYFLSVFDTSNITGDLPKPSKTINLMDIAGRSPFEDYNQEYVFELASNEQYLVAYDNNNYKIVVLDKNLKLLEVCNQMFYDFIDDDQFISESYGYISRHNMSEQTDTIIDHQLYASVFAYMDGLLILNNAYEGPGTTYTLDPYKEEVDAFGEQNKTGEIVDYAIEIARGHQTVYISYDYKLKKLNVFDMAWRAESYELREDGFYYKVDEEDEYRVYPLRLNSKVSVFSLKRV